MVYCFKMLRKLKLLHIFFKHYVISLVIGSVVIAGLFWLGGGLQIYSTVVLCYMYTQPVFIMLRRSYKYEAMAMLRDTPLDNEDKIHMAIKCLLTKPGLDDKYLWCNTFSIVVSILYFFSYNRMLLAIDESGGDYTIIIFLTIPLLLCMVVSPLEINKSMKDDIAREFS